MTHADEIKIVNGEVMLVPSNLVPTGVMVKPEAWKYPKAVAEVFYDRTKVVAIETRVEGHAVDLFHYDKQIVQAVGVKYDSASNTIDVTTEPKILKSENSMSTFPILWFMGMLAMVVSNVSLWRKKYGTAFFATVIGVFAVIFISGAPTLVISRAVVFVSLLVALLAPAVILKVILQYDDDSKRRYDLVFASSVVYYVAMAVLARAVYHPSFV